MKKLFTIIVAGVSMLAGYNATAGIQPTGHSIGARQNVARPTITHRQSGSRALVCDTLFNLNFNTADTSLGIFGFQSPNVGIISGTGALFGGGTTYFPITQVGEEFVAAEPNSYVTSASIGIAALTLNPTNADSNLTIKAYVYDTLGTGAFGGYGLGNALDSASTSMASILVNQGALFTFSHHTVLPGHRFFVVVGIPQIAGDTIGLFTNDGTTNNGHLWYNTTAGSISLDSLSGGQTELGTFTIATVCANNNVGIHDLSGVSELNVYPNPSFGKVNVTFNMESASDVAITVTSITGSKVYETSEKAVSVYNKSLDLSGVAPGVYIVNIKTATGTINRRVSIQ